MIPATGFANAERARLVAARQVVPFGEPELTGRGLWRCHAGAVDDRPLYWQRLLALDTLIAGNAKADDIRSFECASRGFDDFHFDAPVRVAVTGFDPFHLDTSIAQCNPSGLLALQLEGTRIGDAQVRTAIFPVRFADFDEGIVERVFAPLIEQRAVDMIISVSMGRDGFDLERFPGRRRSSPNLDNERLHGGGSPDAPMVPRGLEDAAEFVEFSLPVTAMQAVAGDFGVHDNRTVTTIEQGEFSASSLGELAGQTAVNGSGGGYLSNEISFRLVRLCAGSGIPVGHIHTPRIAGHDPVQAGRIVKQCRDLVQAAVESVQPG